MPRNTTGNYNMKTWNGEPGLLPFFLNPDQRTLERVGFKRAAGCLLSKHCFLCGRKTATANPFTMTRTCQKCYWNNADFYAITNAKAKSAFLVREKDLRPLVSISHQVPLFTNENGHGTSVMYLLSDVQNVSFAKYGGADGLAAEFGARTEKAMVKFNKSQSTDKPQKKKPKVSHLFYSMIIVCLV